MNSLKTVMVMCSLALTATKAFAGIDGGGGNTVACFDRQGQIISTELLDVYEARHDPRLKVLNSTGDMYEDYYRLVNNTYTLQGYPQAAAERKDELIQNVRAFMAIVEWSGPLPALNDHGKLAVPLPSNCRLEQLAIFYDTAKKVKIDQEIWKRLDSLSRAALIQHEMFYVYERGQAEVTSESTRSYVRQMVATSGFTPVHSDIENADAELYHAIPAGGNYPTIFRIHRTQNELGTEDLRLQFLSLTGRPLLVKAYADIPNFSLDVECPFNMRTIHFECRPKVMAHRLIRVPIVTEHRSDWELVITYFWNEPVKLILLQQGQRLFEAILVDVPAGAKP